MTGEEYTVTQIMKEGNKVSLFTVIILYVKLEHIPWKNPTAEEHNIQSSKISRKHTNSVNLGLYRSQACGERKKEAVLPTTTTTKHNHMISASNNYFKFKNKTNAVVIIIHKTYK